MQDPARDRSPAGPDRLSSGPPVASLPRTGIVLAAGRSERLSKLTGGGSKALLRVGGVPLVERAVRGLLRAGIENVIVVVGYQAGPVAAVVRRLAPGRVREVYARDWAQGNGSSLAAAERLLDPAEDLFVLVTMDHLFGDGVLEHLVRTGAPAVLVDGSPEETVWAEGTRVRIRRGAAYAFSKEIEEEAVDCGAFLLTRDIFASQREAAGEGEHLLAAAITRFAQSRPLRAVTLPHKGWWQDIDTPEDMSIAKRRLRRSLIKSGDGPVSRYLNRPLSTRLSLPIASLGISPDFLSVVSAALGIIGALSLSRGSAIAGALTVHACSVLDGVDGEVARLRLRSSARGALLDGVLDRLVDAAVVGGLGVWALADGVPPTTVVVLVAAATAAAMLSMASKDRIAALGLFPASERELGWLLGGRDGRLLAVAVLSLFHLPLIALIVLTAAPGLTLLLRVAGVLRRAE